ncbi:MAG: hypothetical protein ACYDBI_05670 [Thermoplasmataceae archaeon]
MKKIGAVGIIVIIAIASITYYEDATEPSGMYNPVPILIYHEPPTTPGFEISKSLNYTYMGNRISLVYEMRSGFSCHYLNISMSNYTSTVGYCNFHSWLTLSNYSSIHSPYSHLIITVTNTSVSINHPLYKNGTNKNDSFGPYGQYCISSSPCQSDLSLYQFNDRYSTYLSNPLYKYVNPGNFTFYENITFTITLSIGILHFTSQPYHLDESWWQVWEYNTGNRNLG